MLFSFWGTPRITEGVICSQEQTSIDCGTVLEREIIWFCVSMDRRESEDGLFTFFNMCQDWEGARVISRPVLLVRLSTQLSIHSICYVGLFWNRMGMRWDGGDLKIWNSVRRCLPVDWDRGTGICWLNTGDGMGGGGVHTVLIMISSNYLNRFRLDYQELHALDCNETSRTYFQMRTRRFYSHK